MIDLGLQITQREFQEMLDQAAEKGARTALERVGLHDPEAGDDIKELRGLLDAWQAVKSETISTVVRVLVTALLGAIAAGMTVTALKFLK